jgi:hypothetical protein
MTLLARLLAADTYLPLKIAAPAKQGSPHHWKFSKLHVGSRFAHCFQPSLFIRLYNNIMQATSRNYTKTWEWTGQKVSYFTTGSLPQDSSSCRQAPWDSWREIFVFQLNRSSIIAHLFVSAGTCLPSRCLETGCITAFCCGCYLAVAVVYSTGSVRHNNVCAHKNTWCVSWHWSREDQ